MFIYFISIVVGYVLGSISFAQIIAKRHGIDLFKEGSKNAGATNVKRLVGKSAGNIVFGLDVIKGFIAAGWPMLCTSGFVDDPFALGFIGLVGAIVGHSFSIFMGFRGGKGVAVTIGGLIALMLLVVFVGIIAWLIVFYSTRYVSLASIVFGATLPLSTWFLMNNNPWALYFAWGLAVFILLRHYANIKRLVSGTESKFVKKEK